MTLAAIVLGLTALGGFTMLAIRLSGAPLPPTWLALGHGAIAVTGVSLLAYAAVSPGIPSMAQVALGLFVLAAVGGVAIFVLYHLKNLPLPIPIILGHGLLALTGLTLLLVAAVVTPSAPSSVDSELPSIPITTLPWISAGGDIVLVAQPDTPPAPSLPLSNDREAKNRVVSLSTLGDILIHSAPGDNRGYIIDCEVAQRTGLISYALVDLEAEVSSPDILYPLGLVTLVAQANVTKWILELHQRIPEHTPMMKHVATKPIETESNRGRAPDLSQDSKNVPWPATAATAWIAYVGVRHGRSASVCNSYYTKRTSNQFVSFQASVQRRWSALRSTRNS